MNDTQTKHDSELLNDIDAAAMLSVSRSHFHALNSGGNLPMPVKLGRSTRWRRRELADWVRAGCPTRARWNWNSEAKSA